MFLVTLILLKSVCVLHNYVFIVLLHIFLLFGISFWNLLFIVFLSFSVFLDSVIYICKVRT